MMLPLPLSLPQGELLCGRRGGARRRHQRRCGFGHVRSERPTGGDKPEGFGGGGLTALRFHVRKRLYRELAPPPLAPPPNPCPLLAPAGCREFAEAVGLPYFTPEQKFGCAPDSPSSSRSSIPSRAALPRGPAAPAALQPQPPRYLRQQRFQLQQGWQLQGLRTQLLPPAALLAAGMQCSMQRRRRGLTTDFCCTLNWRRPLGLLPWRRPCTAALRASVLRLAAWGLG